MIHRSRGARARALSRRDACAAEDQFQELDAATQRALVMTATGADRPSILFLASDIAPLVADLPAGILARTLVACDDLEHSLVLANLAPGQLQAQIDLWAWRSDGCDLDLERLGDWLENLTTHDEAESLASHLSALIQPSSPCGYTTLPHRTSIPNK